MKPVIIIAIAVGLGAIVAIIGGLMGMGDAEPWIGLDCDEMLDFTMSPEHQNITMDQHMEFHQYYFEHCSETELGKP